MTYRVSYEIHKRSRGWVYQVHNFDEYGLGWVPAGSPHQIRSKAEALVALGMFLERTNQVGVGPIRRVHVERQVDDA